MGLHLVTVAKMKIFACVFAVSVFVVILVEFEKYCQNDMVRRAGLSYTHKFLSMLGFGQFYTSDTKVIILCEVDELKTCPESFPACGITSYSLVLERVQDVDCRRPH